MRLLLQTEISTTSTSSGSGHWKMILCFPRFFYVFHSLYQPVKYTKLISLFHQSPFSTAKKTISTKYCAAGCGDERAPQCTVWATWRLGGAIFRAHTKLKLHNAKRYRSGSSTRLWRDDDDEQKNKTFLSRIYIRFFVRELLLLFCVVFFLFVLFTAGRCGSSWGYSMSKAESGDYLFNIDVFQISQWYWVQNFSYFHFFN